MKSVIFSVFPACGKTWLFKNQKKFGLKILDSDSSEFSWIKIIDEDYRQRNCNNPDYMPKYIKESYLKCSLCGNDLKLQVHHKNYKRHGQEHLRKVMQNDLELLCKACHKSKHTEG